MSSGKRDYIEQRNQELIRAFYAMLGNGLPVWQAIANAALCQCSRFWISSEAARKCVIALASGKMRINTASTWCKPQMILEIFNRCNGDYSRDNVERIVYGGAPQFYLTAKSAKVIVYNELKRRRKCRKEKIS